MKHIKRIFFVYLVLPLIRKVTMHFKTESYRFRNDSTSDKFQSFIYSVFGWIFSEKLCFNENHKIGTFFLDLRFFKTLQIEIRY